MGVIRDFSFQPVDPRAVKALSATDIEQYNTDGFVSPFRVFDREEVVRNRAYFDGLLERLGDDAAYGVNCFQARARGLWDLCTSPRILDHVEDIIGPDIICWASHFFCKMPGDQKQVPWHQDAIYWELAPCRSVTVWLAIDDVDEGNSAMRFLPRTHDKGRMKVRAPNAPSVLDKEVVGWEDMGAAYSNNLEAGQISLHADLLVHGSLPNQSTRRRAGLTIRYCPPTVTVTDETWARGIEAIVCRGSDPTGLWRHHARPVNDDIVLANGPRNVGGN